MDVKSGQKYRHYKGHEYQVLAIAKHSEDLSEMVIYQDLSNPKKVWARPRVMFEENVTKEGETFPRFELID